MQDVATTTEAGASAKVIRKVPKPRRVAAPKPAPVEITPQANSPTAETYDGLRALYDHFNTELFGGALPACLITLQRKGKRTFGYFSAKRFGNRESDATTDEIALNPQHFHERSVIECASVLAHEMVHLWQQHFGKVKSRTTYHNKEWAAQMRAIGLHPTHTGKPDGKETGFQMAHYVVPSGAFEASFNRFASLVRTLSWGDVRFEDKPKSKGGRTKYVCDCCGAAVQGKRGLHLACIDCGNKPMDMEITK
jgi:predicted SprT family Zn-dependent metalloprotease